MAVYWLLLKPNNPAIPTAGTQCSATAQVFRTPFQTAPLDLGAEGFCSLRRPVLERCLATIECVTASAIFACCAMGIPPSSTHDHHAGFEVIRRGQIAWAAVIRRARRGVQLATCTLGPLPSVWRCCNRKGAAEEVLQRVWTGQHGVACRGVNWERHSLDELLLVVACVGARPLAAICRLLAEDYSGWSGAVYNVMCMYVHVQENLKQRVLGCWSTRATARHDIAHVWRRWHAGLAAVARRPAASEAVGGQGPTGPTL